MRAQQYVLYTNVKAESASDSFVESCVSMDMEKWMVCSHLALPCKRLPFYILTGLKMLMFIYSFLMCL